MTLEQQPFLSLPEKASHLSRTAFLSYLIEIYGKQLTNGSILFICDPLRKKHTSLIYDTLFHPLSDTLFEFLNGIYTEIQPLDREVLFKKSSFKLLKSLATALNTNASQSRKESVHKIARQEVEGFKKLLEIFITSATDADLSEGDILDTLTLLSGYLQRFWKSLVRHIFTATQHIAEAYPHIIPKVPETLQYIYDKDWFPENFVYIPETPSETIQKLLLIRKHIQITNFNAETQPFTCTNIPENTNTSLETSPTKTMDTIVHNQQMDNEMNETTETDFNSTLLDDGTLLSSHAVNTIIGLEENNNNNNNYNNYPTTNNTTDTHLYQNYQNRQPINSTELTQNSDTLNTTIPPLPNVNTPLPRLNKQNSVHSNTQPVIRNNSTQPTKGANQNIQITPQQFLNIVRQLNAQNVNQITNAPTPYCLPAASTQTPSPVVRRNAPMMYPYLGGSVPMQQSLRPFDGTDPTYTT